MPDSKNAGRESCPLCGGTVHGKPGVPLDKCQVCGVQIQPFVKNAQFYSTLYNQGYFQNGVYRDYLGEEKYRRDLFRKKIEMIKAWLPQEGLVLNVGCAMGYFLMEMKEFGYRIRGVEISEFAATIARAKTGINIHQGTLENFPHSDLKFDILCFWDVLEHLPYPVSTLESARRLMGNNSLLIIETLNTASITAKLLGSKWPLYSPPHHIYYFNRRSVDRLLRRAGFSLIKAFPIQTYRKKGEGYVPFRYFSRPVLKGPAGLLLDDVILYLAKPEKIKSPKESPPAGRLRSL